MSKKSASATGDKVEADKNHNSRKLGMQVENSLIAGDLAVLSHFCHLHREKKNHSRWKVSIRLQTIEHQENDLFALYLIRQLNASISIMALELGRKLR